MKYPKGGFYRRFVKRPMDFILSSLALVILSPVLLVVAVLVRLKLGKPVLFKQRRPGLNETIFTLYKFRTMTDDKDQDGNLLPNAERLTKFGKLLRSTSLDELPELYNIIKGDMSLVGPRPLLVRYLALYDDQQKRRHEVRPGLSGLAQISGRNSLEWEDRFKLDVKYVDSISFIGDVKIMLKTLNQVFLRKDMSSQTTMATHPFKGSKKDE